MTDYQKGQDGREIALEVRDQIDERLFSPSTARNRDALREVFLSTMPHVGTLLEIASGTGEHAAHIAPVLPDLIWHASDPDETSRRSIEAWRIHSGATNMLSPLMLDVLLENWFEHPDLPAALDGMMCVNMIHIAPIEAMYGLVDGACNLLRPDGKLFLYGPFKRNGETAPSNLDFDTSLKSRNPAWGVRDLDQEVVPVAREAGLQLQKVVEMPANNLSVLFERIG